LFSLETVTNGVIDEIMLVDHLARNGRVTSSEMTPRRSNFRRDVIERDFQCVVTLTPAEWCDAAHIIPKSKGDKVSPRL
jgi:hypothetical protein